MAEIIFPDNVLAFIEANAKEDPINLLLKKSPFQAFPMATLVRQIQGRQIANSKFPFLKVHLQYVYPKKVSLEQASSQRTAEYKSKIINGYSFVDLTGGMGIDTYLLGSRFQERTYVEPNLELYQNGTHNFEVLNFECRCVNDSAEKFLLSDSQSYDWLYIDPSRRIAGDKKTSIHNYEPNVVELKESLLRHGHNVLIKLSPMQDISECIDVLGNVKEVWIISVKNEVKELLIHLCQNPCSNPSIHAIDLNNEKESVYRSAYLERVVQIPTGHVGRYIYQANACIIKAELHNKQALELGFSKLHPNTQLYTSEDLIENYTGRIFEVVQECSISKKEVSKYLLHGKANVITKNFPLSPNQLKSKLKIKDGGDMYVIAYTNYQNEKKVAICKRLDY